MASCKSRFFLLSASLLFAATLSAQYTPGNTPAGQKESLGDTARKLRDKNKGVVRVSPDEARELFNSVDEIMEWVAKDTELPKVPNPKRKMLTHSEMVKRIDETMADAVNQQRIEQSAIVLKKFGFLPRDFDLKKTLGENQADNTGAFYDPKDKTMYLLNYISIDEQKPIIAHELMHAVQDQQFNLERWMRAAHVDNSKPKMSVAAGATDEMSMSRRAVVEGQAMLVYVDYELKALNLNLVDNLGVSEVIRQQVHGYEPNVVLRDAPMMLRDTAIFPYIDGFEFELDLLRKGGRAMAYRQPFANPPNTTHEVFEPEDYFDRKKVLQSSIPDLSPILGDKYVAYDSGKLGELDVQSFAKQYGRENDIYSVARKWDGGSYVAVKRKDLPADQAVTPADLALIYVSRWKTNKAARRLADLYIASLAKRVEIKDPGTPWEKDCGYGKACAGLIWSQKVLTSDGLVFVEVYDNNAVLITQSFDEETVAKLRPVVLAQSKGSVDGQQKELNQKLFDIPAFRRMSEQFGEGLLQHLASGLKDLK